MNFAAAIRGGVIDHHREGMGGHDPSDVREAGAGRLHNKARLSPHSRGFVAFEGPLGDRDGGLRVASQRPRRRIAPNVAPKLDEMGS